MTELNIDPYCGVTGSWYESTIQAIVDNLTPTILKVSFAHQNNLEDEHVEKLVKRCNKITHLNLDGNFRITNDSVQSITKHLNTSLEELNVKGIKIDFAVLLQLKSVATLKILACSLDAENIKNLKLQLPHVRVLISSSWPKKIVNGSFDNDWIWEITEVEDELPPHCY